VGHIGPAADGRKARKSPFQGGEDSECKGWWTEIYGSLSKANGFSLHYGKERMSAQTVFFSWQSDRATKEGRNLVERALKSALERISKDIDIDERPYDLVFDKDTQDTPGSPPIFDTILGKIDRAAVFVPDLTFIAERLNGDPMPNSNVLIEYGYALKSIGHNRIVPVMNTAYGKPRRETMPFDLAHHRFPIQYEVPEGAPDDERKAQREQLAKTLESAIRGVLASDAYRSSLAPVKPPKYRQPLHGRARFRAAGEAIGFEDSRFAAALGQKQTSISLNDGAATWLRVGPQQPIKQLLKNSEIRKHMQSIGTVPMFMGFPSAGAVRASDGWGMFALIPGESGTPAVSFVFRDGEIWIIDAFTLPSSPGIMFVDEPKLEATLQHCAAFLQNYLKVPQPYRWVTGMEGIKGRHVILSHDRLQRRLGPCASDVIEEEGLFRVGDEPKEILEPFFDEVFDQCGLSRPPRNTTAANS
jgi:hypothetical protein